MKYYTSDDYKRGTEQFAHLVDLYKQDIPVYTSKRYRIIDDLTILSTALIIKRNNNENKPLYFYKEELKTLVDRYPSLTNDAIRQGMICHDAVIIIPCSTLFDF